MIKNLVLKRKSKKPIVWDAFFNPNKKRKQLVIFCHGYKGFKDWGSWDLVAKEFSKANLFFTKFNFSHNGGTVQNPVDFPDLEAFAENNYSKELDDLEDMISFLISSENKFINEIDTNNIALIGHSRGGGICILKASEDSRVKKLVTWASVSDFGKRTATTGDLEKWKKEGVKYVLNGRTKQLMPHKYQFYEDFKANENSLNIELAAKKLKIPNLIIHGENDDAIAPSQAKEINSWSKKSELFLIKKANHVFNTKHPWEKSKLTNELLLTVKKSINFIKQKSKA